LRTRESATNAGGAATDKSLTRLRPG
jgi:hypothetical protein